MLSRLPNLRFLLPTGIIFLGCCSLWTTRACASQAPESQAGPQRANRLAKESSPYLLQHAHNPVDWFAWGPEAFAKAKSENKLIFLSIGYSSCHWCHVMERESFANEGVAQLMNRSFVCIKVDREERPDIDTIYMTALNIQGSRGGWPLSMFLTPDGKPIFGGTYWPAEDKVVPEGKIQGFKSVLTTVEELQKKEPEKLAAQADRLAKITREVLAREQLGKPIGELDRSLVAAAIKALEEEFDPKFGGFGDKARDFVGSKFPMPCNLDFLISELRHSTAPKIEAMMTTTLDQMMQGGICDQLEGGFHRYSTERSWTVPHFEKMLYDNAQLLEVYARAYAATGKPAYRRCSMDIAEFIRKRLTSPDGLFYTALDADTQGAEGLTYVWSNQDAASTLKGVANADLFESAFGLNRPANFEKNLHILRLDKSLEQIARETGIKESDLLAKLNEPRQALKSARDRRPQPFLDTKVVTCWNGLAIAGLATAGKALNEKSLTERAAAAAEHLLSGIRTQKGGLCRVYEGGAGKSSRIPGYLDDYTHFVHGLLCLHEATGAQRWLDEAASITDKMLEAFSDSQGGGFFYTSNEHEALFARSKDQFDGVVPSGNSMAARNLVKLGRLTGKTKYREMAERTLKNAYANLKSNPAGAATMATALSELLRDRKVSGQLEAVALANANQDGPTKSDSVVKISTQLKPETPGADGKQELTVTMNIDKGWHLYANPPGQDDFVPSQTTLIVEGKKPLTDLKITYPDGKDVFDQTLGRYKVYEDKISIKATFKRAAGDSGPLDLKLKFQSCSDRTCLLPATKSLTAPEASK